MTASLPEGRLERLREAIEDRGSSLAEIGGPDALELLPRYHRGNLTSIDDTVEHVRRELQSQSPVGKVLWVTNTVSRAIEAADRCRKMRPVVYHSRFKYADRVGHHKDVIQQFRDASQPALAVCTQVAEMSLDLSATLLVTELAPIPALIQRLGRLNRRATGKDDPTRPFVVYEPRERDGNLSPLPYDASQLERAKRWLARLPNTITQRDLVHTWREMGADDDDNQICCDSAWLDGGYRRDVKELRAGSPGITVVMADDAGKVFTRTEKLAKVVIPMTRPRGKQWRSWPDCFGVPIAPADSIEYDSATGATWRSENDNLANTPSNPDSST